MSLLAGRIVWRLRPFTNACVTNFPPLRREIRARLMTKVEDRNIAWTQDEDSLTIGVEVNEDTRGREVAMEVHPRRMRLGISGSAVIEGSFPEEVDPDGSYFTMEEKEGHRLCVLTIQKKEVTGSPWKEFFEDEKIDVSVTNKAYLDVSIGDADSAERVEVGLYGKEFPRTVENFLALCTGEKGIGESGKPLHYKGSTFHRIISKFMAQGGDFTNGDGTGGESIYGRTFPDEPMRVNHDAPMKLCMANAGPDTNGSQFYITFVPCPHLDGNHVVFGEVLTGQDVIQKMESDAGSSDGTPKVPVTIVDCGVMLDEGKVTDAATGP